MRKESIYFILIILILILTGCNQSKDEIRETTIEQTRQAFGNKPKEPNEKTEKFSYYLPEDFHINETNKYNVLLEKGNKSYILFVNQNEQDSSKVSYETLKEQYQDPFISETFEEEERFGYVYVVEIEKNRYEVTVGVGGTKLTTEAKGNDVVEDTQAMMNIVNSVQ